MRNRARLVLLVVMCLGYAIALAGIFVMIFWATRGQGSWPLIVVSIAGSGLLLGYILTLARRMRARRDRDGRTSEKDER